MEVKLVRIFEAQVNARPSWAMLSFKMPGIPASNPVDFDLLVIDSASKTSSADPTFESYILNRLREYCNSSVAEIFLVSRDSRNALMVANANDCIDGLLRYSLCSKIAGITK